LIRFSLSSMNCFSRVGFVSVEASGCFLLMNVRRFSFLYRNQMISIRITNIIMIIENTIIHTQYPVIFISVKGSFFSFEDLSSMS